MALIAFALLALLALYSDRTGALGRALQALLHALFGVRGAPLLAAGLLLIGGGLLAGRGAWTTRPRLLGFMLFYGFFLLLFHRGVVDEAAPAGAALAAGWSGEGGGAVAGLLTAVLLVAVGAVGRDVIGVAMLFVSLPLILNKTLLETFGQFFAGIATFCGRLWRRLLAFVTVPVEEGAGQDQAAAASLSSDAGTSVALSVDSDDEQDEPDAAEVVAVDEPTSSPSPLDPVRIEPASENGRHVIPIDGGIKTAGPGQTAAPSQDDALRALLPSSSGEENANGFAAPATGNAYRDYRLPPLHLLKPVPAQRVRGGQANAAQQAAARQLEQTLASFGVSASVVAIQQGPSVTRYELEPAVGVRVSKIQNLANDIALSLAATDVRIEAPIPGKSRIGIEVPNRKVETVMLREILESEAFQNARSQITVALGKDIAGQPVVASLDKLPHLLIAGATGSGKSVCVNAMLGSLLFKAHPHHVKLLLIDPKMVELSVYNGIPHLLMPVITDPKRAAASLKWLVREMERRYKVFAEAGARDIKRFNAAASEEERLPYIIVVIDELADLMMVAPTDVEDSIQRLAQMARAAGIHMVVATQRPSVDVITGVIKANIPSRIAFAVSSQTDSRVILDMAGAEKLIGKGDMLFAPIGAGKPIRMQGAYLSEQELEATLAFVRSQCAPEFDQAALAATEAPAEQQERADDDDPLLPEAVRLVIDSGQASVSLLQRRFRIGYSRAGRLIDAMEAKGFIGPHQGSKPREVRITRELYQRLFEDGPGGTASREEGEG